METGRSDDSVITALEKAIYYAQDAIEKLKQKNSFDPDKEYTFREACNSASAFSDAVFQRVDTFSRSNGVTIRCINGSFYTADMSTFFLTLYDLKLPWKMIK
jgi:hypothetical protein